MSLSFYRSSKLFAASTDRGYVLSKSTQARNSCWCLFQALFDSRSLHQRGFVVNWKLFDFISSACLLNHSMVYIIHSSGSSYVTCRLVQQPGAFSSSLPQQSQNLMRPVFPTTALNWCSGAELLRQKPIALDISPPVNSAGWCLHAFSWLRLGSNCFLHLLHVLIDRCAEMELLFRGKAFELTTIVVIGPLIWMHCMYLCYITIHTKWDIIQMNYSHNRRYAREEMQFS